MKSHFYVNQSTAELEGSTWWLLAFVLQCAIVPEECLEGTTDPKCLRHDVIGVIQLSPLVGKYNGNSQPAHSLKQTLTVRYKDTYGYYLAQDF